MQAFWNIMYDALGFFFGPVMRWCFMLVGNYAAAIIVFTILSRVAMLPISISQQKGMAQNQRMQLKMRKINARYKGDKQRLQQETQAFYQREGYNPMSAGCSGPMMLQFPLFIGLISAIYRPLQYTLQIPKTVLEFLIDKAPEVLGEEILGKTAQNSSYIQLRIVEHLSKFESLIGGDSVLTPKLFEEMQAFASKFHIFGLELGKTPSEGGGMYILIPILAGVASMLSALYSFVRSRKMNPEQAKNPAMGCMTFGMPLFSVMIAFSFPAGAGFYWIVSGLVSFFQMVILGVTHKPSKMLARILVEETVHRRSREANRKKILEHM
ncbi:MAG: YidC/Oxa1 family membrane protein insertase [Oscillospiraceae bacterium]|nr:YidC/Oxa1 family membrane protein insertase [Oscillospiraceae bacterium]